LLSVDAKGTDLKNFLNGRIHESFTVAADRLYQLGFLDTEERIALSKAIGDALEVFSLVSKDAMPDRDIPLDVAENIIKDAILRSRGSVPHFYKEASTERGVLYSKLGDCLSLVLTAADAGEGVPLEDTGFPGTGLYTDKMESLIKAAVGDEQHAIAVYFTMILGIEDSDPNVKVLRELQSDEQVHERMLLRMLGNDLPILEPSFKPEEMEGEAVKGSGYDKLKQWGLWYYFYMMFCKFTDVIQMAIGDERHAIALYNTIQNTMAADSANAEAIKKIMTDEQDHEKKLLRMLGEKTPEPVEA